MSKDKKASSTDWMTGAQVCDSARAWCGKLRDRLAVKDQRADAQDNI